MYDFFDNHGKKLLAIVGSLLMLTFLLPGSFGHLGGGDATIGTIGGRPLHANELQSAREVMAGLGHLLVPDPQTGQGQVPLPDAMFGPQLARSLRENPLQFYLLMDEAQRNGGTADPQNVEFVMRDDNAYQPDAGEKPIPLKDLNPNIKDALRADVRVGLAIGDYFRRAQEFVKVSRPLTDNFLARQTQQIKARVAIFNGADFAAKVDAPTADELKRQFDAYADTAPVSPPNVPTENNPFGFGYRVPDRVHLQYLSVGDDAVSAVVDKTQPAEKWNEDAMVYYLRHPSEFQTSTTQPTTRPFAEASADALKKVKTPRIDDRRRQVATLAAKLLAAAGKSQATTATSMSDAGGLNRVADEVAKQTGVRPTVVDVPGLVDRNAVRGITGLGSADPSDPGRGFDPNAPADTADYLFGSLRPFVDAAAAEAKTAKRPDPQPPAFGVLDVNAPSKLLRGTTAVYVVRATAAVPAHAAVFADVKDAVEKDVRRTKAYNLAQTAAQDAVKSADAAGGLEKVAGLKVTTTDWFGPSGPLVAGLPAEVAAKLAQPAFDTLAGLKNVAELPRRTVAKLRADDRAVALEVFDVKAQLSEADIEQARESAVQQIVRQTVDRGQLTSWFGMDGIAKRVNFVTDSDRERRPSSQTPGAGNPFSP